TSGCTATASVTVTVDNSPITVSTGNSFTKTCTANTAGASIGETAVGGNIYSWTSVPAGFTSTEANPMVNPDQTTVYTVAKTNSASGCTATASVTVTVGNSPITVSTGNSFTKTCTANTAGASIGETAVTGNTYSWTSVPTGFSSADANPIVNPDQTTIYNVVKTNSASGCTATANVTVTVDNSPITVSAGNPFTKTCTTNTAGASIGETAVTGNTYSWTSVPEGFTSADANPTVNPDQTNIYTVVKTNSASGCTATANVTITVDNSPITVSAGNPFTKTCTANINGASIGETAVGGNIYSWTSVPAGFTSIEANPIVNPDQTTIYTVIKTNSASGCTATASVTVTVDNSPITVSTGNSFTKTCTANTAGASIGETAVAENTYSWTSVPAGFTSADANPTVNPDQTTIYTVLKTNTASGCTATASVKVTVNNSPITVSAGNPFTKTCTDNTAGASIGETVVTGNTYSWTSVPAGFSSTDANPIVNPDQTTIYTVVKTNSASGCTATASVTITVDNSPITVSAGNP
ncbi:beta strand repeat-containing protein, partial [Flavobacterium aquicola]|uniref:beta strand repeat-containing protein n=1 Tax=Flavobacterium aquicola TaxID=1682742 RepID=UPI001473CB89